MSHDIATANKLAKSLGLTRASGTYNGQPYWRNALGQIVTINRVFDLAGY